MLDDVGASDLNLLRHPQLVVELEDVEEYVTPLTHIKVSMNNS